MNWKEDDASSIKLAATESPHQLGRVERQGGTLKHLAQRIIESENVTGDLDVSLAVTVALEVKNSLQSVSSFSLAQWVLGRNPRGADRHLDGLDRQEDHPGGTHEDDPTMEFA